MFLLSTKKDSLDVFLDINSGDITAAIVLQGSGTYKTLWHHKERCVVHEDLSDEVIMKRLISALFNIGLALQTALPKHYIHKATLRKLVIVTHAPWVYTLVTHYRYESKTPHTIDEDFLDSLYDETEDDIEKRLQGSFLKEWLEVKELSNDILSVRLNGYEVRRPLGKTAKLTQLQKVIALTDKRIFEQLSIFHEKFLPKTEIAFTTNIQMLQQFAIYKLHLPNALLLDMSGEVTEIAVMEEGILQSGSFSSIGVYDFARTLLEKKITTTAEDSLRFMQEDVDAIEQLLKKKKLEKVLSEPLEKLQKQLAASLKPYMPPAHVFIRVDAGYENICVELLKRALSDTLYEGTTFHVYSKKMLQNKEEPATRTSLAAAVLRG